MRKLSFSFLLILTLVWLSNCSKIKQAKKYYLTPCYYDKPVKQTEFPQFYIEVDLDKYYSEVRSLSSQHFSVNVVERVRYKGRDLPILELNTINSPTASNAKKLLILAGVHGNESAGTLAILELLRMYNSNPHRFDGYSIKIVTPINPAGTIEMSRHNECGCDLNRKFSTSSQKGIVLQRKIIDAFDPDAIISLHEAPSADFLIHSNKHLSDELLIQILDDIKTSGVRWCRKTGQ